MKHTVDDKTAFYVLLFIIAIVGHPFIAIWLYFMFND